MGWRGINITMMDSSAAVRAMMLVAMHLVVGGAQKCSFDGQFLPNEADCHSFFKCDHGRPVPFQCGPGTAWSRHLNTCDYTHLVPECQVSTTPEEVPLCEEGDLIPYFNLDFNKYQECTSGEEGLIWITKCCPVGEYFNQDTKGCQGTTGPNSFPKCTPGHYSVDPEDPSSYFQCYNDYLIPRLCYHGEFFNIYTEECGPWTGDYDERSLGRRTQCFNGARFVYDDRFNSRYYECLDGALTVQYCPDGYSLDTTTFDIVDHALSQVSTKCKNGAHFVDPEDDQSYFVCQDDLLVHYMCPEDEVFYGYLWQCARPELEPQSWHYCNDGERVPHDDVTKYYECRQDVMLVKQCRPGHSFDSSTLVCQKGVSYTYTVRPDDLGSCPPCATEFRLTVRSTGDTCSIPLS